MNKRTATLLTMLLGLAAVVLANLLAQRYHLRADLTADRRYTLSPPTMDLLRHLPETVTVTAYFTQDLPPDLAMVRQDFMDLLTEYAARSGGKLVYEFKDPSASEALRQTAVEEGVRPLLAQTRANDRSVNLQVLMGAVVRMADRKAVIPAFQKGPGMEWTLSSALAQLLSAEKPLLGVLQGHGEPALQALDELAVQLNALYDVEATVIYDGYPINDRFASLLIIDPKDSIPESQLQRIDEYMAKGHGVVLAFTAIATDFSITPKAELRDIGITRWLGEHGVRIVPGAVVDQHCGQVGVMQSGVQAPIALPFPYYPLLNGFSSHPVARGLDLVMFQFAAPIAASGPAAARFSPILRTGAKSGVVPLPFTIDLRKQWTGADFPLGPQVVGAAVEGTPGDSARLVVFGNGNFCTGDQGGKQVQLPKGNLDLMVNAADWVTRNTALLDVRGKTKDYRPIRDPGEAARTTLKWTNLLLPVAIALLLSLARAQWRRRQRRQRMLPGHVR